MQTHNMGIWLDWCPSRLQFDYSLFKATPGNGIDCAFCSISRSCERPIRYPSSRRRPSVYKFRISCSATTGNGNNDNSNENPIVWEAEKDSIESERYDDDGSGIEIEVEKIAKNRRRIQARVSVQASLDTVWNILTDYERLADFIPSLTVSQLLEKGDKFARLLQIGQQNLVFGLKFKAKGVIDCYEKDIQNIPYGQRRDIEFKMTEGDFKLFEGKWSIEQSSTGKDNLSDTIDGQGFCTTLFYVVEVEPKAWLPVRLVQGRLCRDIKMNLSCIQKEAEISSYNRGSAY